jgi:hypothetical protein
LPAKIQEFKGGEIIIEIRVLGQVSDAAVHGNIRYLMAQYARTAVGREDQSHQQLQRRRLAGAVGPEKTKYLTLINGQRKFIQGAHFSFTPEP